MTLDMVIIMGKTTIGIAGVWSNSDCFIILYDCCEYFMTMFVAKNPPIYVYSHNFHKLVTV